MVNKRHSEGPEGTTTSPVEQEHHDGSDHSAASNQTKDRFLRSAVRGKEPEGKYLHGIKKRGKRKMVDSEEEHTDGHHEKKPAMDHADDHHEEKHAMDHEVGHHEEKHAMDHEDDHHEKKHDMDHEDDHHERRHVIDRPDTKFHQVKNEANRGIVEMLNEMAGKHFLLGHQQKGIACETAAKSMRETEETIHPGTTTAEHFRGIGEHTRHYIDEFLETGKVKHLEDLRQQVNEAGLA